MIIKHGVKEGRKIGFPTLNIYEHIELESATYYCEILLNDKKEKGLLFYSGKKKIEIHLIDFNRDCYGEKIEILKTKKLRAPMKYSSKEEKIIQMKKDIEMCAF